MTSTNYISNTKFKRKIYGIVGAFITLIIPFFIMLHDDGHLETEQSFCPFKMTTGFPCPGCGITKSLVYFYEGQLYKSFYYHILGPFVVVFCVLTILILSVELKTGKDYFNRVLFNKKLAYRMAIFLAAYHLIRLVYFVKQNSWDSILTQTIWR